MLSTSENTPICTNSTPQQPLWVILYPISTTFIFNRSPIPVDSISSISLNWKFLSFSIPAIPSQTVPYFGVEFLEKTLKWSHWSMLASSVYSPCCQLDGFLNAKSYLASSNMSFLNNYQCTAPKMKTIIPNKTVTWVIWSLITLQSLTFDISLFVIALLLCRTTNPLRDSF